MDNIISELQETTEIEYKIEIYPQGEIVILKNLNLYQLVPTQTHRRLDLGQ